jgi:DNA-binding GntR family transcriptional regulator
LPQDGNRRGPLIHMPAKLLRLPQKRTLEQLRLLLTSHEELDPEAAARIVSAIDRQSAAFHGWTFVMIGPEQHAAVVRWLRQHSDRPLVAIGLWAELFTALDTRTGEILLTRDELAERIDSSTINVSRVMSQLESVGAIIKLRQGRAVRFFMNPRVGTHLPAEKRIRAQARAPELKLVGV